MGTVKEPGISDLYAATEWLAVVPTIAGALLSGAYWKRSRWSRVLACGFLLLAAAWLTHRLAPPMEYIGHLQFLDPPLLVTRLGEARIWVWFAASTLALCGGLAANAPLGALLVGPRLLPEVFLEAFGALLLLLSVLSPLVLGGVTVVYGLLWHQSLPRSAVACFLGTCQALLAVLVFFGLTRLLTLPISG